MRENSKPTENESNFGNITIIILSSISLVFILSTIKTPNSYLVEPGEFSTGDEFTINVKERGVSKEASSKIFNIQKEGGLSNKPLSTSKIFAESLNKEMPSNIQASVLDNGEIIVTETKGRILSIDGVQSTLVNDTPSVLLQDYFQKIVMVLVLFFMIFYLIRNTVPILNSSRKLKDETEELQSFTEDTLDSAQEMDKDIHTEALMRMSKNTNMVLDEYEKAGFSKITVVSRNLSSDIADKDLQKQVVKNILSGVKYRWIISSAVGRGPFDQLLLTLLDSYNELLKEEEKCNKSKEEEKCNKSKEDGNTKISDKKIEDCFDCITFYSIDAAKFLSLPYELNFYFSKNDHQMIAFEKEINLNLSNCCEVDEVKKIVDNWMLQAEEDTKDWLFIDDCNSGISCSSNKPKNHSVIHYSENLKTKKSSTAEAVTKINNKQLEKSQP